MSTPKRYPTTRALLDELLEGVEPFRATELDTVRNELEEDDFLDFKGGNLATGQLKDFLWEHVTGFANAAGGVLVLGVNDQSREVENIARAVPGTEEPHVWAEKVLASAAARVHPPPRFLTVRHGAAKVLVIATDTASPALIPLPGREPRYAMRIGQSTVILPPHLVADLLVGRRAQPILDITGCAVTAGVRIDRPGVFGFDLQCVLENNSFVHARRVVVGGIVHYLFEGAFARPTRGMLQEIEEVRPAGAIKAAARLSWQLCHPVSSEIEVLRPFESVIVEIPYHRGNFTNLPFDPDSGFLQFGLYVLAEGAPPAWYQGILEYVAGGSEILRPLSGTPKLERLVGRRPIVSWRERGR